MSGVTLPKRHPCTVEQAAQVFALLLENPVDNVRSDRSPSTEDS